MGWTTISSAGAHEPRRDVLQKVKEHQENVHSRQFLGAESLVREFDPFTGHRAGSEQIVSKKTKNRAAKVEGVTDGLRFKINPKIVEEVIQNKPEFFKLKIRTPDGLLRLELYSVDVVKPVGFLVNTDKGPAQQPAKSAHYRGVVENVDDSLASISFYKNGEVNGFIQTGDKVYNLGALEGSSAAAGESFIHDMGKLGAAPEAKGCDGALQPDSQPSQLPQISQMPQALTTPNVAPVSSALVVAPKTVTVYLEADYKLYTDKGSSVSNVTSYLTSLFSQVATMYANEGITLQISEIFVWTTPDPYVAILSSSTVLGQFRVNRTGQFTGHLAHFVTTRLSGGIAYLGTLCSPYFNFGFSSIYTTYSNAPTYSCSVHVMAHEIGHNLGSPHTHSCSWTVGGVANQTIDGCTPPEQNACPRGPSPPNGGTMMSYCHLYTFINFNLGFGQQPGDRIRSSIASASCLTGTVPSPTPTPSPTPSVTPSPSPSPKVSPAPSPTPSPTPSVTPSPSPSPKVSPTPTPTPSPSPTPSTKPVIYPEVTRINCKLKQAMNLQFGVANPEGLLCQ